MSTTEILRRGRERNRRRDKERERKRELQHQRIAELRERWARLGTDELLDELGACLFIGGSRPIHPATLWRGVKKGVYSRPIKVGEQAVRWPRCNLQADIARSNAGGDTHEIVT